MLAPLTAVLAATLVAADPAAGSTLWAQAIPRDFALGSTSTEQLADVVLDALPPPPTVIERKTRYFGTVTIDHQAHLARRAACAACHGPGPVSKLVFTPKIAHERCISCHREQEKGPTTCRGCHEKADAPEKVEPPARATVALASPEPAATRTAAAAAAPTRASAPVASTAPIPSPARSTFEATPVVTIRPLREVVQLGVTAGRGPGFAVRAAAYVDEAVVAFSVDRMTLDAGARTLGLVGAGITQALRGNVWCEALAVGGFDGAERPKLEVRPALGARLGLGWRPGYKLFHEVSASITGAARVSSHPMDELRGTTVYGTLSTGFSFPPR